jgi:hypothetical protein
MLVKLGNLLEQISCRFSYAGLSMLGPRLICDGSTRIVGGLIKSVSLPERFEVVLHVSLCALSYLLIVGC